MYNSFEIRNFRCFEHLKIKDLARVNLIAGKNNVGKTALLEAVYIHASQGSWRAIWHIARERGLGSRYGKFPSHDAPWISLFRFFDSDSEIAIESRRGSASTGLRLRRVEDPDELLAAQEQLPLYRSEEESQRERLELPETLASVYAGEQGGATTRYLLADSRAMRRYATREEEQQKVVLIPARAPTSQAQNAIRFRPFAVERRTPSLVDSLRVIEPRLRDLEALPHDGDMAIHADIDGLERLVPLGVCGDGMNRLTSLVLGVAAAPQGVVLVDEVENGLHHTVLQDVWKVIGEAARRFDTQVFATTHSFECIRAAHEAFSESEEYDFRLHRLQEVDGQIEDFVYDQETLEAGLEMGLEVR